MARPQYPRQASAFRPTEEYASPARAEAFEPQVADTATSAGTAADAAPAPVPPALRPAPWAQMKYYSYHPHVYRNMVGEHSPGIRAGAITAVYDKDGRPFGTAFCNLAAKVALRVFAHGPTFATEDLLLQRLRDAVALRREWLHLDDATNAYRVIHADGDGLGGLVVDRYADTLSIEVTSLAVFQRLPAWLPILHQSLGTAHAIVSVDDAIARVEGIDPRLIPPPGVRAVKINEHGLRYHVDFAGGHKTGFFCDQRDNRRKLAALAKGRRVLDICCYTGGFSLSAKQAGAADVTGVDLDEKAVALAKANANLNQLRVNFVHADAFSYMRQMQRNGTQWDVVLLDPPKFMDSRENADEARKKYNDLNVLGLHLVAPGGLFITCSCSGLLPPGEFEEIVIKAAHRYDKRLQIFDRTGAGPDHPAYSNYPASRYLKTLWTRLAP